MALEAKMGRSEEQPLAGKRILITRARSQAEALARKLESLGAEVLEFPTIEVQPPASYAELDRALDRLKEYDWLIFTSVNGVEKFFARAADRGCSIIGPTQARFAAIGPATARKLARAGIENCLVPQQYQAEGLLDLLLPEAMQGKKVLIPRAARARDILPETLRLRGAQVDVVEAYRTVAPDSDAPRLDALLRDGRIDVITFTSSSTVANFIGLCGPQTLAENIRGAAIACIGHITKSTVEECGGRADIVATESTIDGLVRAIAEYFA